MGQPDTTGLVANLEIEIGRLMPTAVDMVAAVVEYPGTDWDTYAGLLEVAEQNSPLLLLAVVRLAAGLAAIAEMTPDQIRAFEA